MPDQNSEHQLGDFIKGRFQFIEDYCQRHKLDKAKVLEDVKREALRMASTPERRDYIESRLFKGIILSTSFVPDWVDQVFLEATTRALKGPGAALYTASSRQPCIPFEAGRFNAHRQSETTFKILYAHKKPEEWLKTTFPVLYRQCYGAEAGARMKVEELAPKKYRITMDNHGLAKSGRLDCATAIGYIYGSLEKLGAKEPLVTHEQCGADPGSVSKLCVFDASWQ